MRPALACVALIAAAAASSQAWAYGNGWDSLELQNRHWRTATLDWANDIHPDHMSPRYLQDHVIPPPEELYCHPEFKIYDDPADCAHYEDLLEEWVRDFLDLSPNESLPSLPFFPHECQNACLPYSL